MDEELTNIVSKVSSFIIRRCINVVFVCLSLIGIDEVFFHYYTIYIYFNCVWSSIMKSNDHQLNVNIFNVYMDDVP